MVGRAAKRGKGKARALMRGANSGVSRNRLDGIQCEVLAVGTWQAQRPQPAKGS